MGFARLVVGVITLAGCDAVFGLHQGKVPPPTDAAEPPPSSWASVSAGNLHSCGIHLDGTLWCWGRNDLGQLGTAMDDVEDDVPAQVGTALWRAVSVGGSHSCGIQQDLSLWCWGDNGAGEVGMGGSASPVYQPTQVAGAGSWMAVAAGTTHTCGIRSDGSLWCWGDNQQGEVGNSNKGGNALAPVQIGAVGSPAQWTQIASGDAFSCALGSDRSLWCWGTAQLGQLANGTLGGGGFSSVPTAASGSDQWQALAAGGNSACAIDTAGKLRCWGDDSSGQLGDDMTNVEPTPVVVAHDDATWTAVAIGVNHACGLHADQTLYCWGADITGQLAVDIAPDLFRSSPVAVTAPAGTWLSLAVGDAHTCAIDAAHELWCAGLDSGQLGVAGGGSRTVPVEVGTAMQVALGGDAFTGTGGTGCTIDVDGHLRCWGDNAYGQVGDGTTINRDVATAPAGSAATDVFVAIAAGNHSCAIDAGHALYCWGLDAFAGVGNNDPSGAAVKTPVLIPSVTGMGWGSAVAVDSQSCAVDLAGSAACWGYNAFNQAGQDATQVTSVLSPTPIMTMQSMQQIGAGDANTCAVSSGQVLCWGDAQIGESGPQASGSFIPSAVTELPPGPYGQVAVGGHHTCVGAANDQFACFGDDIHGQLGNQTTAIAVSTPFVVPGSWQQMAAGGDHTCGIHTDGTLACWGTNRFGELGVGSFIEYHEPQLVGSDTDWATVVAGEDNTCAIKSNRDLYCWGRNIEGEVGDGRAWRTAMMVVH